MTRYWERQWWTSYVAAGGLTDNVSRAKALQIAEELIGIGTTAAPAGILTVRLMSCQGKIEKK